MQRRLGIRGCGAFDVQAACSGFVYGLDLADRQIRTGGAKNVLVIGAETLSRLTNWEDRTTAVLFGDGAGAVVVSKTPGRFRLGAHASRSDGAFKDAIWIPAGGALQPLDHELLEAGAQFMRFGKGTAPFRRALDLQCDVASMVLDGREVDHFLPHQANARLIELVAERLAIPGGRVHMHLERYGNTSAASIPILLDESSKHFRAGETLLLSAVGAGLSASASLLEVTA